MTVAMVAVASLSVEPAFAQEKTRKEKKQLESMLGMENIQEHYNKMGFDEEL